MTLNLLRCINRIGWSLLLTMSATALHAEESVDYDTQIKPLLRSRCYACHGVLKSESSLRVDKAVFTRQGGDSGPAIVPGNSQQSLLIERVSDTDEATRMPPEGEPLTAEQIALLQTWINQGATAPPDEQPEQDPREHWSFRVPVRSPLPVVNNEEWSANPIDCFIAAQHESLGLTPRPVADRAHLLRRVSLDLIGLPPTADELREFLTDDSPDAYERAVDQLLESPQYGERWARHWMDVWRYADWFGRRMVPDVWNSAPQIWRWRDWIVTSLNDDKSYARMVQEMLAADEVAPEDPEASVATGYLIRNWYALNHNDWMRSNVEHTAKAFLGLTFNCAHCHDHKYDPILQDDYFRLRAFFEPIGIRQDRLPGEADPGPFQEYEYGVLRKVRRTGAVSVYDKTPASVTWFYEAGDERQRDEDRGSIAPGVPAIFGEFPVSIEPVELPVTAYYPAARAEIRKTILQDQSAAVTDSQQKLATARQTAEAALPELRETLAQAQSQFETALASARSADHSGPLTGDQSLLLDATTGRRIINYDCQSLTTIDDGLTIRFQLHIAKDTHFNFQLAKDVGKGLTAGFVGFIAGRITGYQPGTFTEFDVGEYDHAGGEQRFVVEVNVNPEQGNCLLSVRSLDEATTFVENVPVALNGWNPVGDPTKAITFDAREGSVVLLDEVQLLARDPESEETDALNPLIAFNFEAPEYEIGHEIVGTPGWTASSFCVAPASSLVSPVADAGVFSEAVTTLMIAKRAVESQEWAMRAAESQENAARLSLASVESRIAADDAKYGISTDVDVKSVTSAAIIAERDALLAKAEAEVARSEHQFATAKSKPLDEAKRDEAIHNASKQLTEARTALSKLQSEETSEDYSPLGPVYASESTGRRKALSEWIGSRTNPLTARVAVNHIWMRHFHAPLVSTVYDFGRNGSPPTHPELLDWLAVELMESGWSMKHLHRLIVTSRTYRSASSTGDINANVEIDPSNKFLWRMNVGRMQAEVVRDSLLHCANCLDLTVGGQELENKEALTTRRRSLYYSCQPESDGKSQFGALFDAPDPNDCYRRTRSIVPQQALALTNSDLIHELSGSLAESLRMGSSESQAFVVAAYEQILSRPPSEDELTRCLEFLERQQSAIADESPEESLRRASESLVRVLFSHNDFIGIR
ncbi:MAG: DUF1553 domain-containing protein [Planctomycetaceae bacterium]|nr:DUF1553 domain-containing protein [Planctomycetaceae bacterium]